MVKKATQRGTAQAQTKTQSARQNDATSSGAAPSDGAADAVSLLKNDHRKVEQLFKQYEAAQENGEKQKLAKQICTELIVHAMLEEELFYPACRQHGVKSDLLDEAQVEHDGAKVMISEIMTQSPGSPYYDAKVSVLSEYIKHHVAEEEKPGEGILAKAKAQGVDLASLGQQMQTRKQALMSGTEASNPPQPRSLGLGAAGANRYDKEYQTMQRNYQGRDDQGRFSGDDNRGGSRGGSRGGYSRYQDDERGNGGRFGRGSNQERDEYGRFASDDDRYENRGGGGYSSDRDYDERSSRGGYRSQEDDRYGSQSQSNYRERDEYGRFTSDDDRYESRGGGRYSSDRDYDERGQGFSSRGGYRSQDDDRYGSQSQSNYRERDEYGRFTSDDDDRGRGSSSRGGSRSSSGRSFDEDDRERDEQGRFTSSGRGGSGRSSFDEDDRERDEMGRFTSSDRGGRGSSNERSGGSRSSRGGQGGGDHRGWFGDSRGHAEAARRGWQHRNN